MKQSDKKGARNITGALGEEVTVEFLSKQGFSIIEVNYLKKWGEIDIIAQIGNKIHFVEVKTFSYETKINLKDAVSRGTYRPEEHAHPEKMKKVARTAETWVVEHNWKGDYQLDVAAVRIVPREKYATIRYLNNVILE